MTITYGQNSLSAYALFTQRKRYEEDAYPLETSPSPFDLWRVKTFYARIDPNGVPIYPLDNKLKRLEGDPNKSLFALNFVANAFEDFRRHYLALNKEDATGTAFEFMTPHEAYQNPLAVRDRLMQQLYTLFTSTFLLKKKRYEKVISFRTFLEQFKVFFSEIKGNMPITLSSFLFSNYLSPLSSAVMIEIADAPYGNDEDKCVEFLQNVCFRCYSQTATKFGFKIDKNIPWRLIADLKSPCMAKYMSTYMFKKSDNPIQYENFAFNTMFPHYYNKSYVGDVNAIIDVLSRFYYSYISENPVFTRYYYSKKCGAYKKQVVERERISQEMISEHFPLSYWLNYYIEILSIEVPGNQTNKELGLVVAKAQTKLRKQGLDSAVEYVFETFKENMLTREGISATI